MRLPILVNNTNLILARTVIIQSHRTVITHCIVSVNLMLLPGGACNTLVVYNLCEYKSYELSKTRLFGPHLCRRQRESCFKQFYVDGFKV